MRNPRTAGAARCAPAVFFVAALAVEAAVVSGCARQEAESWLFEGSALGTTYAVKVVVAGELSSPAAAERREEIARVIPGELEAVNSRMSTYLEDSELSRFNRHGDTTPFAVSAETREVFAAALEVSRLTGGAFDVTVAPLVNAWGFGPRTSKAPEPTDQEIAALLAKVGFAKLAPDPEANLLRKRESDLFCDLSGIAKGYAVDRVAEALAARGARDFLVEVGGEVRAAGRNRAGRIWRIGIERPQLRRGGVQRIVALDGAALATSGDYRRYRERDGVRFSHIIDPRTGRPIRHRLASVSVVHPRCMMADALATGLMVMGPAEGYELAVREKLAALFLVREGDGFRERATPGFEELTPSAERQRSAAPNPNEEAR